MTKFLISILCNNNIDLLKLTLYSVINQLYFDDYHIYIIINSIDELFYNKIIEYFRYHDYDKLKKIIKTDSNNKPGLGHNYLLYIFKHELQYDNLIILDSNDLFYPITLDRINKVIEKTNCDILTITNNTKIIKNTKNIIDYSKFNINIEYRFKESQYVDSISSYYNKALDIPFKLLFLNRKVLDEYDRLYDEDMYIYDDYYYFLIFYKIFQSNNFDRNFDNYKLKILNISDKYMYISNEFYIDISSNEYKKDFITSKQLFDILNINSLECEKIPVIPYTSIITDTECDKYKDIISIFYKDIIEKLCNIIPLDLNLKLNCDLDYKYSENNSDNNLDNNLDNNSDNNSDNNDGMSDDDSYKCDKVVNIITKDIISDNDESCNNFEDIDIDKIKLLFIDQNNWNYNTKNIKPMDDSELAMLYLTEQVSRNSLYNVLVLTNSKETIKLSNTLMYKKLTLKNINKFKPNYIICQNVVSNFVLEYYNNNNNNNNNKIILWIHCDINASIIKTDFLNNINTVDIYKFIFVSNWQKNRFIQKYNILPSKCYVLQNGIPDYIIDNMQNTGNEIIDNNKKNNIQLNITENNNDNDNNHDNDDKNKLNEIIFVSSPYKGLLLAYAIFKEIRKYIPDIKLKIFSSFSSNYNDEYNNTKFVPYTSSNINEIMINNYNIYYKNLYDLLVEEENIEFYGSVPQDILFKHMKTAKLLLYPNTYPETSCISILECMAYNCNIISSELGAIPEICNGYAKLFNPVIDVLYENYEIDVAIKNPLGIDKVSNNYISDFVKNTIALIHNYYDIKNINLLKEQFHYICKCKWSDRAIDFSSFIGGGL